MSRPRGWNWVRKGYLSLAAFCMVIGAPSLFGHQVPFDSSVAARRLAAVEEKDPYRLRSLVRDGRPTLIAFIDHLCHTCLRSVGPIEKLKQRFAGRANVVVIDPARISAAHTWAKDYYQVWFVPKFVLIGQSGEVVREHFGPTPAETLASDLRALLAR
ncbi:MAG: hypothetical protein ACE5JS_14080 [Nitrospinota bacterium]